MHHRTIAKGLAALVLGSAFLMPQAVFAYQGNPAVKGPNYTQERHEAMTKAFATGDYNAWKTLMNGKGRVTQVVTAQNFSKFAQAHTLALEGKKDEANKIRAELGLGTHTGAGAGMGYGRTNR